MYRIFDVIIRRVAAIAAFLLVLCSAPSCLQQEEYGKHSDGYREAGGMSCALEPETKSILYNGMNTAGTGSWFAAIYNSEGKLERNVVDIRKEISFTYPHVHVAGGFDTDNKGSDHDSPYVYGYLDDTYTIFLVINIPPCNGGNNLVELANRMFPENLSDVNGRLYISDFETSEGATGYEAIHDYNLMPKSGKMVSASFRTGVGTDVVPDTTSTIQWGRLLHPVQFSLTNSNGDISKFNPSESYICNMAADIDVFDFNNSKPQSVIAHSFEQLLSSELTTLNNGGEVFFYVLENCQGTVSSITSSEGRTKDNLVSLGYTDVAAKATYIETVVSPTHQRLDGNAYLRCYLFDGDTGSNYSSFNVTRDGYTRLAFDVNYERFVNPDWQVDFQGTEKKFDYYFESTGSHLYSKDWNVLMQDSDGHDFYGDQIHFINHFLQHPETDLLYYFTVHNYKNASGNVTTRTWGPFYRNINDTDGWFDFSKYNGDVHNQYVDYYGSEAYGFKITCMNDDGTGSGYGGDELKVKYFGQMSTADEYWTVKAVIHEGQANEESVSIDLFAPVSDTPVLTTDTTFGYVGQEVYMESNLDLDSWSVVDTNGNAVSSSIEFVNPDASWNRLLCEKAGDYVILLQRNGHVTRQPFTVYDPVLQYNAGNGWKDINTSLFSDWQVDESSKSVSFRYVDREGNAITDFSNTLFNELLALQYTSSGAMFSNNALSASISQSPSSMVMNVNLAALNSTQYSYIIASQDGASEYASHYVIHPKYRASGDCDFQWYHAVKRVGRNLDGLQFDVDNRYYLSRSSNGYAIANQVFNLDLSSVSSVSFSSNKSYTVTPIVSSSSGRVNITGLDIICGPYKGDMKITMSIKNNAGSVIFSKTYTAHVYLSAGVGLYTHQEHGDWFVSPVYINTRNDGANIRNLIGGGVVYYNSDTEYQDYLDICSEDFGLKNGAHVSSGLGYNIGISAAHTRRASDLPSDSVNLSKAYRDYVNFVAIPDPANSLSTGIRIGDSIFGNMYDLSFVESFEGARNDSGNIMSLTQGSNAFGDYFETSGSYIRIFNYMNKNFEF